MGDRPPTSGDLTTQLDVASHPGAPREELAYVVVRLAGAVSVHRIGDGVPLVFGRGQEATVFVDDARVSRRHAEVSVLDGQLVIDDLGSRNGTRIGATVLRKARRVLARGDEIAVGPVLATVVALPAARVREVAAGLVVADPRMRELFALAERLAAVPTPVLIRGETGAGKEIVAEVLHRRGPRAAAPLVRLNCAAVPEALLESELFGHERGAFTGAAERKRGYLEVADGGTLFLDEVGDLPLAMQAKLLRALETQRMQRVGGREEIAVDVRFVCATHRDLQGMVSEGTFRGDLYFRIAGFVLEVPPLRERRVEVLPLAERFAAAFAAKVNQAPPTLSADACDALLAHGWPGNLRELKHAIEHAVVLAGAADILPEHLPRSVVEAVAAGGSMRVHVDSAEKRAIEAALVAAGGNRARAADILGVSKRTLQYRLAKLGTKP